MWARSICIIAQCLLLHQCARRPALAARSAAVDFSRICCSLGLRGALVGRWPEVQALALLLSLPDMRPPLPQPPERATRCPARSAGLAPSLRALRTLEARRRGRGTDGRRSGGRGAVCGRGCGALRGPGGAAVRATWHRGRIGSGTQTCSRAAGAGPP